MEVVLERINPEMKPIEYLYLVSLVIFAALLGLYAGDFLQDTGDSARINEELNSSNNIVTVDFYNNSVDFLMEDNENTIFYLDRNRDGSADERLETQSDGGIHQETILLDYRKNIYRLYYRYQDDPRGEAWFRIYRVEALRNPRTS